MIDAAVGRRYAHALFLAALQARAVGRVDGIDALDAVEQDLMGLRDVWKENPGLARFLESPDVNLEEKQGFLGRVFPKGLSRLSLRFLVFLLEKKRIEFFLETVSGFHDLAEEHRGRWEAHVTTRAGLTGSQREKLGRELERLTGKTIRLIEKTDPGVIGGVRVRMRDRVIDRTIRSELVQLREKLLSARLLAPPSSEETRE
jgi:F-type H+-transporting ATPase subunit delta